MIRNNKNIFSLAIVGLMMLVGCTNITPEVPDVSGGGSNGPRDASVVLTVSSVSSAEESRAVGSAGSAVAGEKMNNLTVLITKDGVVHKWITLNEHNAEFNDEQTEALVSFENLDRGEHEIFLIANTPIDLTPYTAENASVANLKDALVGALTEPNTPSFSEANGMPMTAILPVSFKQGVNLISGEVERVVARVSIVAHNHVLDENYRIVVANFSLGNFNASNAYLFNHDYTAPGGIAWNGFAVNNNSHYVENGGEFVLFDDYVYEGSAPNGSYTMGLKVAVFGNDVFNPESSNEALKEVPTITTAEGGPDTSVNHYDIIAGHQYFLRNAGNNRYLYINNNGYLALSATAPTTNDENYLWVFSGNTSGTIRNVGTGHYLQRSGTTLGVNTNANYAENFVFGSYNNTSAWFRSSYTGSNYKYFLANSNNSPGLTRGARNGTSANSNNQRWYLHTPRQSTNWTKTPWNNKEITHSANLTIIDSNGRTIELTEVKRNAHIKVGVNIFFNPEDGYFNFEVVPWKGGSGGDVTFD